MRPMCRSAVSHFNRFFIFIVFFALFAGVAIAFIFFSRPLFYYLPTLFFPYTKSCLTFFFFSLFSFPNHTVSGRPKHLHVVLQAAHRVLETVQPERQVQQRQVARLHEPDAAQRRQHGNGNAGRTRRGLCGRQPAAAASAQPASVRRAQRRRRHPTGPSAADHQRGPQPARGYETIPMYLPNIYIYI